MNELELEYEQSHELDPDTHPFELHPQLAADTVKLGEFPLSDLLLMNDANYPWFILVPRRVSVTEIFHLSAEDQGQLLKESSYLAENLRDAFNALKMNIAALGNVVPQLHLHHVVRYSDDPTWPAPVWGAVTPQPYTDVEIETIRQRIELLQQGELYRPC
ncbi:HIT domain-containing protein [Motiliproteus sediminis]|uniref:HIT domain-containing protein n=1 Tax=Motiliproteus sediminis TaxID=1468178 RepID=UPI001AEFBD97|nr:HIT domain-containing protein [Motiliproteus sediminis]